MTETLLQEAFRALAAVYAKVDAETPRRGCRRCGECCHFETFGHRLFATYLEALYLVAVSGKPPGKFDDDSCPYQRGILCTARSGRVLGCRTFFCESAGGAVSGLHERALADIRRISTEYAIRPDYAPLARLIGGIDARKIPLSWSPM